MLLILPTRLDSEDGDDGRGSLAVVTWALASAMVVVFVAGQIAVMAVAHDASRVPEPLSRLVLQFVAAARLYSDHRVFAPWQLWSYCLIHDDWWQLIADVILVIALGRGLERRLNSARWFLILVLIVPLAGLAGLARHGVAGQSGAAGLIGGAMGLGWAVFRAPVVRSMLAYWLVVIAGLVPLRPVLATVAAVYLGQDLLRLALAGASPWPDLLLWGSGLIAGAAIGLVLRLVRGQPVIHSG